ncbi:MAG: dolichyl-diphosphooligosaccharide--protein glycosyltransferase subunit STT3 [Methanobacterium sp.]|nr:dolichyl-diphosphooligosaccharide--protein glycosyltransferase subunit STT3 [Methanobacterium sp.]
MSKKELLVMIIIILIIFSLGFLLRFQSVNLTGIPSDDKAYYQDDNGLPYFYELDSYYNYRLTKNLLDHGYIGETLINGKQWDTLSYYPPGVPMDYPPLLPYLGALFYKIVNIFGSVPLLSTCFWLPALIGPLAGVVAYLFLRRFTNEYGAASAGLLMSLAPYYFIRTVPGWYDTDMFNMIFPLLVVWFFMEAVLSDNFRNRIGFVMLAAVFMVMFSLAWNGWQYYFYLLVIFSLIYFIWDKFQGKSVKNSFYILGIFTILTIVFAGILGGYLSLINLIYSPFEFLSSPNVWLPFPYMYTMVSELSRPAVEQVFLGVGISFFGGILGFLCMYRILINEKLKKQFLNKMNWFFYSFLIIWTIVGIFTILSGGRFIIMLIPPLVISTGFLVGLITDYMKFSSKGEKLDKLPEIFRKKSLFNLLPLLFVVLIISPVIINVYTNDYGLIPLVNDDLNAAAEWINNPSNVSNDTVIITAWTWGHFYTAIADRPVVFDGRMGYIETLSKRNFDDAYIYGKLSPSVSREYWIDKAFSTDNESLSVGIFRMLATNGDYGYLTLDGYTKNTTKSVDILNNILGVDKQSALSILKNSYEFNDKQAENILNYSHPSNPRPYILITNNGMVSKGYSIFHFGVGWDFTKQQGADITYSVGHMNRTDNILKSDNNVVLDLKTGEVTFNNKTPFCVMIIDNNSIKKQYPNDNSDFSIILIMDTNQSVVMDKGFEDSLFTKLVMMKSNSTYYKSIYENKDVTIWKITD